MLLSWDKTEILNAPSSVLLVNSDLAHAAGEGTSVLRVVISHWFMYCLICELAHSCTELDQTLQLCRINLCFLFIFPRPASAFARMTNRVQISLAESSQTHRKAHEVPVGLFWVSQRPKEQSLQGMEHLEHTVHRGLSAHCWLLTLQLFSGR